MKPGKYTIRELFVNREVEQIIIPEIQRDYVWKKEQVEGLLTSVHNDYEKFTKEEINITADNDEIKKLFVNYYKKQQFASNIGFIYAYNDAEYKGKYFLIDGQQRVTTVYLLLLNLFISTDEKEDFKNKYFKDKQLKIDFKVRESSHDFFKNFIGFCLDHDFTAVDDFETVFSKALFSQYWYFDDYKNDKTIQSIICNYVTLNSFVEKNKLQSKDFLNYILDYVDCWYFDTNISEQGEELYIYMNARGEQIQNNENIKADLLGALKDIDVAQISNREDFTEEKSLAGIKKYWGKKWEDWQDFFWVNKGSNVNADEGFNEFLRWVQIISMSKKSIIDIDNENENSLDKKDIIEVIKWEKKGIKLKVEFLDLIEIEKYIEATKFIFSSSNYTSLKDIYVDFDLNLGNFFEQNWLQSYSKTESKVNHLSQIDCFRIIPILEFVKEQKEIDDFKSIEIYRFARYLFNLSRIDNISKAANVNCINAIKLATLLQGSTIKILELEKISKSLFTAEEKAKFQLYKNPPNSLNREFLEISFWDLENVPVFKGEIAIAFDYINFDLENLDTVNIDDFIKVSSVFISIFKNEVSDLFRKAILSVEDYKVYESYTYSLGMNRYHLCKSTDEWNQFIHSSSCLRSIILRLQAYEDFDNQLKAIIDENINTIEDWRLKYLKSELSTLRFCQDKRVCVDGSDIYLLKTTKVYNEGYYKQLN